MVISGVAVSAAFGVPLGTLLGQGLGWRGPFVVIVVLAGIALATMAVVAPSVEGKGNVAGQAKHAFAPRVLAVLGLNAVIFASLYAALTYIVPFLQNVTGITGAVISIFLFAYGAATAVGSLNGGRFADLSAARTLMIGTVGSALALLALYFVGASPVLVFIVMLVWGLFAFGMVPSIQLRVVSLAGPGGELANSLPASAVNIGIALGPIAGGIALSGYGPSGAVFTGMLIAVVGAGIAWATSYLKPPVTENAETAEPATEASKAPKAA
jgi:DHA1 family inner membrane transport protein